MFFDNLKDIPDIAARTNCAIFATGEAKIKNALTLRPAEKKTKITIEEVRDFVSGAGAKQTADQFLVISPADALTEQAQNALLKNLEEPGEHYHFVLFTKRPTALLPTILSRSHLYFLRPKNHLQSPVTAPGPAAAEARRLIQATARDLPEIADKIAKSKDNPRAKAQQITAAAIEILTKSYFETENPALLAKLQNFLALEAALANNGHVKLHIIADLC